MRKQYSKPDIAFDDFSLTASIAVNCEIRITGWGMDQCAYEYDAGVNLFLSGVPACEPSKGGIPIPDDPDNGFCYHVPIESNNLFNS